MNHAVDFYSVQYGGFFKPPYAAVRAETYDEDIGQDGWLTAQELREHVRLLQVGAGRLFSTPPAAPVVRRYTSPWRPGAACWESTSTPMPSRQPGTTPRQSVSAAARASSGQTLLSDFPPTMLRSTSCLHRCDQSPARPEACAGGVAARAPSRWTALVHGSGGGHRPVVERRVCGPSIHRSVIFAPVGVYEGMLELAGFRLLSRTDTTESLATIAGRWNAARSRHATELRELEGDAAFDGHQRFLAAAATLARERRLSRFSYVAVRNGNRQQRRDRDATR